ncbi:unnamed protein product, partial [Heterotrigona itama]
SENQLTSLTPPRDPTDKIAMDIYGPLQMTSKGKQCAILTDQGANFVSKLMMEFEEAFRIKHIKTTNFLQHGNGSFVRAHSLIGDLMRTCTEHKGGKWDEILNLDCSGYNTVIHEDRECTPFELIFDRRANLPSAIAATTAMSKEEIFLL